MKKFLVGVMLMISSLLSAISPDEIHTFWFGKERNREDWFRGSKAFDEEITKRFSEALKQNLDGWKEDPRSCLALILLYDQFPRNMFRGSKEACAYDSIALELTLKGIEKGWDLELSPFERLFFYMPLQHVEDLNLQRLSVAQFEKLSGEVPEELRSQFEATARYARLHHDVIERFGRFPHRNAILNRVSTPEEETYLKKGSPFKL